MDTLYHGSQYGELTTLLPAVSFDKQAFVYATTDRLYALVRAGKFDYTIPYIREDYSSGKYVLAELQPNAFMDLFNCEGWIYEVPPKDFVESPSKMPNEFVCSHKVKPAQACLIPNLWSEIQAHLDYFKLVSYEDVNNEYWSTVSGGRDGYMQRRLHNIEVIQKLLTPKKEK